MFIRHIRSTKNTSLRLGQHLIRLYVVVDEKGLLKTQDSGQTSPFKTKVCLDCFCLETCHTSGEPPDFHGKKFPAHIISRNCDLN